MLVLATFFQQSIILHVIFLRQLLKIKPKHSMISRLGYVSRGANIPGISSARPIDELSVCIPLQFSVQ